MTDHERKLREEYAKLTYTERDELERKRLQLAQARVAADPLPRWEPHIDPDPLGRVAAEAELHAENERLRQALARCCQCRFEGGVQYEECHLHACQRHVRLPNGDPSEVTLEARVADLEAAIKPLVEPARFYRGTPDDGACTVGYGVVRRAVQLLEG
jgi:hypothetical protein